MTTTTIRKTLSHTPFQALLSVGALLACLMIPQHAQAQYYNGRNGYNQGYDRNYNGRHDNGYHNGRGPAIVIRPGIRPIAHPIIVRRPVIIRTTPIYYYPQPYYYNYAPAPVVVYNEPVSYQTVTPVAPTIVEHDYIIGERLSNGEVVPQDIAVQLRPAPRGYIYRMHGSHVYLVRQNDSVIAQIFDSLLGGSLL